MDQEPTLLMVDVLTNISRKKSGLEGPPGRAPRHLESPDHPRARSWCRVDPPDARVLVFKPFDSLEPVHVVRGARV